MMIPDGKTAHDTYNDSVQLAILADKLGYHRIWYSEHHGMERLMNSAPELMIAHIAAKTDTIRLGSGGVMMPNHRPYKLAEVFKTLATFAPGRIDFGVGRAPGGTMHASRALNSARIAPTDFYDEIEETMDYITNDVAGTRPLIAAPVNVELPEAWLLGSSGQSAYKAAELGMGYSHAQFIGGWPSEAALVTYRQHFKPSAFHSEPVINASFHVAIAETEELANYHASSIELSFLLLLTGQGGLYPADVAQSYPYTAEDRVRIAEYRNSGRLIVGTAQQVAAQLKAYEEKYGISEFILASNIYDQDAKRAGFTALAEELEKY